VAYIHLERLCLVLDIQGFNRIVRSLAVCCGCGGTYLFVSENASPLLLARDHHVNEPVEYSFHQTICGREVGIWSFLCVWYQWCEHRNLNRRRSSLEKCVCTPADPPPPKLINRTIQMGFAVTRELSPIEREYFRAYERGQCNLRYLN
jgi:hypothetical protein